jgi:DNA-directed RNA polymerase sigma subunit (sigma70/sigma32)
MEGIVMANYANLPAPTPEGGLNRYMQEIRRFPMLEPEQEYMLAKAWVEEEDTCAWPPKLPWATGVTGCRRPR